MSRLRSLGFGLLLGFAPVLARAEAPGSLPALAMVPAFPALRFSQPVLVTHAGDGSGRLFVVEQKRARIAVFAARPEVERSEIFLDLGDRVDASGLEQGLLGLAFHPEFCTNRRLFVYYTAANPARSVLSEFRAAADGGLADPGSERVLLRIPQPTDIHKGGALLFGPDGHLYLGLGDGGGLGDPRCTAQDLRSLLGKILRLDVDRRERGRPYAIPTGNPLAGKQGVRPEIWAWGFRNPWRLSFDRVSGELWAGDVGQDGYEEIDRVVGGGNYGWSLREGRHPFRPGPQAAGGELIDPVLEYSHAEGGCIIGGVVYRGRRLAALHGAYLWADYITGRVSALRWDGTRVRETRTVSEQPENISSFGEGEDGELYVSAFDGRIYRFEPLAPGD